MSTPDRRTALSSVLLLLLLMPVSLISAADVDRAAEEDNIREAVFRHQFEHNGSGQQQKANAYCLSILLDQKKSDPSDEFIKRFAGHKPPVRRASECHWTKVKVVENRTGRSGLILFVSSITWVSDTEVTVGGGYEEANLSASSNTYTVKKQGGQWTVTEDRMNWISRFDRASPDQITQVPL